jgi:serine/threonine protein kinase
MGWGARVMARIVHPRVVALLGAFIPKDLRKGQQLKIVMELFGKDDIEKVLLDPKTKDQVSLFERVKWMKQVAEGMAWIHGAGIVHRDLKVGRGAGVSCLLGSHRPPVSRPTFCTIRGRGRSKCATLA